MNNEQNKIKGKKKERKKERRKTKYDYHYIYKNKRKDIVNKRMVEWYGYIKNMKDRNERLNYN